MSLDDSKENDYSHEDGSGVIIIIDNDLLVQTGTISIDWNGMGFNLQSENPIEGSSNACDGCGTACPGQV